MKIAVNTRLLIPGKLEGIGRFSLEILREMVNEHKEDEFLFIFDRKPDPSFLFAPNITPVVGWPQARHPLLWYLFFENSIPAILRKHKPDVFFSPDGWLSLKSKIPSVPVIHDLNFEHFPEFLPAYIVRYYKHFFPRFARKATRILTVSEFTKGDIADKYGIQSDKIFVAGNAVSQKFQPLSGDEVRDVRNKYSDGVPYFLFVGLIHPRKNLLNQLKAFEIFQSRTSKQYSFLVIGSSYSQSKEIAEFLDKSEIKDRVKFLGRMEVEELRKLYAGAFALMYVSYFEGFGIPILEAMQCEVPVITSNTSSMPEVCADAGIQVAPDDVTAISEAMLSLDSSEELRADLIKKGRERVAMFSWKRSAEVVYEVLKMAAAEK